MVPGVKKISVYLFTLFSIVNSVCGAGMNDGFDPAILAQKLHAYHPGKKLSLTLGESLPWEIQTILKVYEGIFDQNKQIIHPQSFFDPLFHKALTYFFNPEWPDNQAIPTDLEGLEDHYGKIRKIHNRAYLMCKDLLGKFPVSDWMPPYDICREEAPPIGFTDPLTGEKIPPSLNATEIIESFQLQQNPVSYEEMRTLFRNPPPPPIGLDVLNGILNVPMDKNYMRKLLERQKSIIFHSANVSHYLRTRRAIGLDHAIPEMWETPIFLLAIGGGLDYLCDVLIDHMKNYTCGLQPEEEFIHTPITDDNFTKTLYQILVTEADMWSWEFLYVIWCIKHYDVFSHVID